MRDDFKGPPVLRVNKTDYTLAEVLQNEKALSKVQSADLRVNPAPGDVKAGRCATGE